VRISGHSTASLKIRCHLQRYAKISDPLTTNKLISVILGIDANAPLITWFWDVLEEFSNEERSLFLRFVWGRTRLPRTIADFRGRDFVIQV
jgi:E3 ubiquitin-protein ligase HERC2